MQIITSILVISVIIGLLGCIPYAIWVVRTALQKCWKKVGLQLGLPSVYFAMLAGSLVITQSCEAEGYTRNFYDADAKLGDPVFRYESERSFNGDGASLSIYALPEPIRQRFEHPDRRLLGEYPRLPYYRGDWQVVAWREAPFDSGLRKYLQFALYAAGEHSDEIQQALSRKGTYYAFFHYDHGSTPGNIDFFIVDLQEGRIYEINVNT